MLNCALQNHVTLAAVCTACYTLFLLDLVGDWDVIFETFLACRPIEYEAKDLLGCFFHIPILRVNLEDTKATFITLLRAVQSALLAAFEHARCTPVPASKNLPNSTDKTGCKVIQIPIPCFHFHEIEDELVLDATTGTVLNHLYNDQDGILAAFWIRGGIPIPWSTNAFYKPRKMELMFAQFFSVAAYDESVIVSRTVVSSFFNIFSRSSYTIIIEKFSI
jgi:hypothetical protein